jgi:hypothetical protein
MYSEVIMRLYYQLDAEEQDNVIDHCVSIVLDDIIENGLILEPHCEHEEELKVKFDMAKEHIATIQDPSDKIDYLMNDQDIADAVFDIAMDMAKNAFYHEQDEMVFFPDALGHDHTCEHNHDEDEEPFLLPAATRKKDLN